VDIVPEGVLPEWDRASSPKGEAWQVCLDTPFGRDNQAGVDNAWEQKKLEASLSW